MKGKGYIVFFVHSIIWSGYSLVLAKSSEDHPSVKFMMFIVFFYLSTLMSKWWTKKFSKAYLYTTVYIACYFAAKRLFDLFV